MRIWEKNADRWHNSPLIMDICFCRHHNTWPAQYPPLSLVDPCGARINCPICLPWLYLWHGPVPGSTGSGGCMQGGAAGIYWQTCRCYPGGDGCPPSKSLAKMRCNALEKCNVNGDLRPFSSFARLDRMYNISSLSNHIGPQFIQSIRSFLFIPDQSITDHSSPFRSVPVYSS